MGRRLEQRTYLEPTGPGCLGWMVRAAVVLIVLAIIAVLVM